MSAFHPFRPLEASERYIGSASAGWQIAVEDVRSGFPLAADLPPYDDVFAGVGLRGAVGRNR
jgi:hypothetical protein